MQSEEKKLDPERSSSADGKPDGTSLPLPVLLRVPWFPQETTAPVSPDAAPVLEDPEAVPAAPALPRSAWRERKIAWRHKPIVAVLAGCFCAIAVGAVVDELWWSRPKEDLLPMKRSAGVKGANALPPTAPLASEIEPLASVARDPKPAPAAAASASAPVQPVVLAPEIIPLDSGEEP